MGPDQAVLKEKGNSINSSPNVPTPPIIKCPSVPNSEDEAPTTEKLYGRNEATGVEFIGWTNNIITNFIGAKSELNVRILTIQDIESTKVKKDFRWNPDGFFEWAHDASPLMKLADLNEKGNSTHFKISQPVTVQVLDKKAVEVMLKSGNAVFMMGKIFVGDETGFCQLATTNDTIESLYNQVEIGDRLVLMSGSIKRSDYEVLPNYFKSDKFLKGELKVRSYDTRKIFNVHENKVLRIPQYLLPEIIIWLPCDLVERDTGEFFFPLDCRCINVAGVVSYVGRISRTEIYREEEGEGESSTATKKAHYSCYRWIQLVDHVSKEPLSIKMVITNLTWIEQKHLVPGTAVVLTNVEGYKKEESFLKFHLKTSSYTRIYQNKDIVDVYSRQFSVQTTTVVQRLCGVLSPAFVTRIFARQDITWAVGGTLVLPIANPKRLQEYYDTLVNPDDPEQGYLSKRALRPPLNPSRNFPLVRREERRLYVRGFMYKTFLVSRVDGLVRTRFLWPRRDLFDDLSDKINDDTHTTMALGNNESNWFSFQRKFPLVYPGSLQGSKTNEVFAAFDANWNHSQTNLFGCLLLPSNTDSVEQYKELPCVDTDTYLLVYIADPVHKQSYCCWFNTFALEPMLRKLDDAYKRVTAQVLAFKNNKNDGDCRAEKELDQSFLFIIDVHRVENPVFKEDGSEIHEDNWEIRLVDFCDYHPRE